MIDDLKVIRKKYGEKMYHFCRESFPTLLEEPGKLLKLLSDNFHESHFLFDDIVANGKESEFKNFIYSLVDVENNNELVMIKTPEELMSEAGYVLVECYNEEDIQKFRKYYAPGEELCTFKGGRLDRCKVFFAVKKNVLDIKREDFKEPKREDEYGTSVISIQFTKDGTYTLSIKNRYNHTVNNPDATFSNNLDNIIPGLTKSFERYKGIIQMYKSENFEIKGYVRANDGKYYKYNEEINNVYYCPDNIIIDHFNVKKYDKSRYLIIDYFVIDLSNKSISLYDKKLSDSFCDVIKDINKIEIDNIDSGKKITILGDFCHCLEIITDKDGKIISLKMNKIYDIGDKFLSYNTSLQKFTAEDLIKVADDFLRRNNTLQELYLPNLTKVGHDFLFRNNTLQELYLPNLKIVGDLFLWCNNTLQELYLPNLKIVGHDFLRRNETLQKFTAENLTEVGNGFLGFNTSLQKFIAENLTEVGNDFLCCNTSLQELYLPNLTKVGDNFLDFNTSLQKFTAENLTEVGNNFLWCNNTLQELYFPNLTEVGSDFLYYNTSLQELYLPNLKIVGRQFLYKNTSLQKFTAENLTKVGNDFLCCNASLQKFTAENLTEVGSYFLFCNKTLQELYLPNLTKVGYNFLNFNTSLQKFTAENLTEVGDNFLRWNETLQELYLPNLTEVGDWFLNYNHKLSNKILSEIEKRNRKGRR